jgi:hypothetical protein
MPRLAAGQSSSSWIDVIINAAIKIVYEVVCIYSCSSSCIFEVE